MSWRKHSSSGPSSSSGSENTGAVKPRRIVCALPAYNPTSRPWTNETNSVVPTESYLDGVKGSKGSDEATTSKHVNKVKFPAVEEWYARQAKENLRNKYRVRREAVQVAAYLKDPRNRNPRKIRQPCQFCCGQFCCGGRGIPRSIPAMPSVPAPPAAPFAVSAYGPYVPDGPHTSVSEDAKLESGDDADVKV